MDILILLVYSSLLCFFLTLVLFPAGHLLCRYLCPALPGRLHVLCGWGLSCLIYACLTAAGMLAGAPNRLIAAGAWLLCSLSLFRWLKDGSWRCLLREFTSGGLLIFLALYLLCVLTAAYPSGALYEISPSKVQALAGLAFDNIIPYNFSRYLVEQIPFQAVDVIPTWKATDRGPLAGTLNAVIFMMLGLEEHEHWLRASPLPYFFFQCLLVYLNLLAYAAVWLIALHLLGQRAAGTAALFMSTSYFFLQNTFFTWPKLFMSYYVLAAFAVCSLLLFNKTGGAAGEERKSQAVREAVLSGVLWGGALLAHEIAAFYIISAGAVWTLAVIRRLASKAFMPRAYLLLAAAAAGSSVLLPWAAGKWLSGAPKNRLLYLHLMCMEERDLGEQTLSALLRSYFSSTPWREIVKIRLGNLYYPFDLLHTWPAVKAHLSDPYAAATALLPFTLYQLIHSVGVPLFFLALSIFLLRRRELNVVRWMLLSCSAAIIPAALLLGCPLSTWTHAWGYPAFLAVLLAAAAASSLLGGFGWAAAALGAGWNSAFLVLGFWFREGTAVYLHASPQYLAAQCLLWVLLVGVCLRNSFSD